MNCQKLRPFCERLIHDIGQGIFLTFPAPVKDYTIKDAVADKFGNDLKCPTCGSTDPQLYLPKCQDEYWQDAADPWHTLRLHWCETRGMKWHK